MFKLIVPLTKPIFLDDAETLIGLAQKYPKCYYKAGMHKDKEVLFVLGDLETRKYGPSRQLSDGSFFYEPEDMNKFDLEKYENNKDQREFKIEVKLASGRKLWVKPATLEPQVFSLFTDDVASPYSQATEYGRLAYSIYDEIAAGKEIKMVDPRIKQFVKLIIQASYSLPLIIFDSMNFISMNDLMNLISAGMGIDEKLLEVKKNT